MSRHRSSKLSTRRRIVPLVLAILTSILLAWVLSPTLIRPPAEPREPVVVYVLDRGYHSRLILPQESGSWVQYAYGDWHYFALHQQGWPRGLAALLLPTQGTLGRRVFRDFATLTRQLKSHDTLLPIVVARNDVVRLRQSLAHRFRKNFHTRVVNPRNGITFVQDDQDYTLLHNSNHELVGWLRQLNCQVQGFILLPDFQLSPLDSSHPGFLYPMLHPLD